MHDLTHDTPLWTPLALLLQEDDAFFSEQLPDLVKANGLCPHDTALLWRPEVLARLCALSDPLFVSTVLTLAGEAYIGLTVLYEQPIMARVAALAYAQLHGAFLKEAKVCVAGFDAPSYRRELRPYLLRHSAQMWVGRAFAPLTGAALFAKNLPPLDFVVEDILPVGATLFVGRAKDGKSLAVWNLCLAVASGGIVFGRYATTPGPVLYLALEDGERRAKQRLLDQMRSMNMDAPPAGFEIVCWDAPRVGEGLEEHLHGWLDTHPGAKLIVIDILEKVRPPRTRNGSVYAEDYAAVAPLQRLAQERGIALLIVHHTHKAKVEDFRDAPSGSMSLLGAVDTLWNLRRVAGETDAVLQITGRDLLEMPELAMEFRDGFWTARGDAATTVLNPAHQAILETLRTAGYPMTPTQLATVLDVNLNTMKVHLMRLTERGLVWKDGQGHYAPRISVPERAEGVTSCNPVPPVPPPPVIEDPDTAARAEAPGSGVENADEQATPLMDIPGRADDASAAEGDTVTPVTRDASQTPPAAAGNGHTHDTATVEPPPQFCPGCGDMTCWLDRGGYYQCAEKRCSRKVLKQGTQR